MPDIFTPEADRLRSRAALAALACRTCAFAIPTLLLLTWVLGKAQTAALVRLGLAADHPLGMLQTGLAASLSLLPALALAQSLVRVAACFDGFAQGDWFGAKRPGALGSAGRWLMLAGVLALIVPTFLGLALTMNAAPGMRVLAIQLSSSGILGVLFGALLWALGHLWDLARRIAAENAEFV